MWKILSSKTIFEHPRIVLEEDTVELPNGAQTQYLRFKKSNDCVTIIAKKADGTVLLTKEYSHPIGKIIWQFPGGGMKTSEQIKEAAERELREESNVRGNCYQVIGAYLMNNRRSENKMHVVAASDIEEASGLAGDQEEVVESFWKQPHEIDEMIQSGEVINCHTLASWSIYRLNGF